MDISAWLSWEVQQPLEGSSSPACSGEDAELGVACTMRSQSSSHSNDFPWSSLLLNAHRSCLSPPSPPSTNFLCTVCYQSVVYCFASSQRAHADPRRLSNAADDGSSPLNEAQQMPTEATQTRPIGLLRTSKLPATTQSLPGPCVRCEADLSSSLVHRYAASRQS